MPAPPEPETKSPVPAGEQGHRARSQIWSNTESDTSPIAFQAAKLRRVYCFCYATARTIASLAFAGGPR